MKQKIKTGETLERGSVYLVVKTVLGTYIKKKAVNGRKNASNFVSAEKLKTTYNLITPNKRACNNIQIDIDIYYFYPPAREASKGGSKFN